MHQRECARRECLERQRDCTRSGGKRQRSSVRLAFLQTARDASVRWRVYDRIGCTIEEQSTCRDTSVDRDRCAERPACTKDRK
jgi:hypothetical protein